MGKTLDIDELLGEPSGIAAHIAQRQILWQGFRQQWMDEKKELRNYLFATDTRSTANNSLPWKNSTTVPKLTQIRDNLHSNYMEALMPNDKWLNWEGDRENDESIQKKDAIEGYMRTKLRRDRADLVISQLLLDYIDYGNCFATLEWADESVDLEDGSIQRGYVGPRLVRISPYDIVFDPTAPTFASSPKITRAVFTIGELVKKRDKLQPGSEERKDLDTIIESAQETRATVGQLDQSDHIKNDGFQMDGFSSWFHYFHSGYVEVLTFHGDLYDIESGEFLENHIIKVIDRRTMVSKKPNPNWAVHSDFYHSGWRTRPDNLYAMGPLDNLVGMQYRIDHLENLKADVFDFIAFPMLKIRGYVEDFDYKPGGRIYIPDEDGDVSHLAPDVTALNADTQIRELEQKMEELAGAPREAMGIRSPGEKTKFEVQKLDNAASRIFLAKIKHFERSFLEPLLNGGLALARRNMSGADVTRTLDSEVEAVVFATITRDDIIADGILRPIGASHFAQKANTLQNIIGLVNSAVGQDPAVNVHWSGKKLAKLIEELSDLDEFSIFSDNARVAENAETQRLINGAQENVDVVAATPDGVEDVELG